MADVQTRPFSRNYSGLINQSVIALGITVLCVGAHELMKRRRRGDFLSERGLGSRESWEFGYLYQGRSWARFPSPPTPRGWALSWVKPVLAFSELEMLKLRGIDATLYIRFLRGCFWFTLLQSLTTFPILFPIHVRFSDATISPKSMTRASISSLVGTSKGLSLLWIHICLLFWVTLSWMATLLWICKGAFELRSAEIDAIAREVNSDNSTDTYYPHPHPQYGFTDIQLPDRNHPNRGLRCRTIMVSNVPSSLRDEKQLKEYFEYYMTRKVEKPSMGLTSSTQPGFLNKSFAFIFNRAKRLPSHINPLLPKDKSRSTEGSSRALSTDSKGEPTKPLIERVTIARKMTELASLMERREEILRLLETAHIKLATKILTAVKVAAERRAAKKRPVHSSSKAVGVARRHKSTPADLENGGAEESLDEEVRMEQLIRVLGPFVEEFGLKDSLTTRSKKALSRTSLNALGKSGNQRSNPENPDIISGPEYPPTQRPKSAGPRPHLTIWDALLSLPRSSLDAYQPLINLEHVFRGQVVPSIDYYTTKLNLLTTLITEQRSKPPSHLEPVSTAFVTFADPDDARKACKYLAVHPNNPLACLVTLAPMYSDLDWIRVMKSSFRAEFVKDWVVNLGVWGFTLFWLFPVSLLVGLVSIQNISVFWPSLQRYLDRHPWESEVIQSFLPTLLVALLALLIPLVLLLIAKKAHTITTLSALHDRMMTRYYKFLIVNVLIFFCVGTAALQSFLESFRSIIQPDVLRIVAGSFPTAGPFYVGWLIFTTAMHAGFELALFGLPLIMYPTTKRQITPRKRAVGTRPRTFNFYYWLPNHVLVIHVVLLFSVLNPFVLPFATLYFFVQCGVIKNQLIHVYAKNYERSGQLILIRVVRYSLDGLILTQAIFLAYMVVLKKTVNVGLSAFLIAFTAVVKILFTRMCRIQFEHQDILEANILCNKQSSMTTGEGHRISEEEPRATSPDHEGNGLLQHTRQRSQLALAFKTWKLPNWVNFTYNSVHHRVQQSQRRPPIPFGTHERSFSRLNSISMDQPLVRAMDAPVPESPSQPEAETNGGAHYPSKPRISTSFSLGNKPVVPHPPPIPWDDQKTPDLPYDNPFYTRVIDNVLWLPRNPCGILNLDDTVDMKTSLTVELTAGQLGTFPIGLLESASLGEILQASPSPLMAASSITASPASFTHELPHVDGTEEIELPATIARRVQAGEADIEHAAKSRLTPNYRGKLSGAAKSTLSLVSRPTRRRQTSFAGSHNSTFHSTAERRNRPGRDRSHSIMSALQLPPPLQHTKSSDHELGFRHETQSLTNAIPTSASASRLSLAPPMIRPSRSQNLSASSAIFREVLAEEESAKNVHIMEEQTEAGKVQNNKSWLTSWMFKKLQ